MIEKLVNVKRSKKAKRVALRLDPVERVINLVVPQKMTLKRAYSFAKDHEDWVISTLNKLPQPIPFDHGTALPIFGDTVRLDITIDKTLKRTKIKQHDDVLEVKTYQDDPTNRITTHIRSIAKTGLADIASDKAGMIGKDVLSVRIGDTKSRWGSCSQDKKITFSWRLIFAPYAAIDYVVAHEVAHMVHMDHSKDFWLLCEKLCSDYNTGKSWMKANGNSLMSYGYRITDPQI